MKKQKVKTIEIPRWLTVNPSKEEPAKRFVDRKRNEINAIEKSLDFFKSIGFEILEDDGEIYAVRDFENEFIQVHFHYREDHLRIHKTLKTRRDGKRSNVNLFRRIVNQECS